MSIDATRATRIIDENFSDFDTAMQGDASKADGNISQDDLQAIADNRDGTFSREEVDAAKFLLDSNAANHFLDVGAGKGDVDGTISREDIDGALQTIASGQLEKALMDTAAGKGGADGYISDEDVVATLRDPGIPQGLKNAIAHLPAGLPLPTQLEATFALRNNAGNREAVDSIRQLISSPAFKGLGQAQQQQALALFGGTNAVSQKAREDLASPDPLYGSDHDPNDPATFKVDLNDTDSLQAYLSSYAKPADKWRDAMPASGVPDSRRQAYTVSEPVRVTHAFPSGTTKNATDDLPALKYTVTVDGKSIDVYMPAEGTDTDKYAYPTIEQIAKGLAAQPGPSIDATREVVLNPVTPKDSGADMYAGNGTISINPHDADNPREQKDLDFTFMHESAHLVNQPFKGGYIPGLGYIPGWNEAVNKDHMFSTHYAGDNYIQDQNDPQAQPPSASPDPAEDFAEAYMIYHLVKGTPDEAQMRALMPARFAILDRMFPDA